MLQGRVTVLQDSVTVRYKEEGQREGEGVQVNSLLLSVTTKVTARGYSTKRINEIFNQCPDQEIIALKRNQN